MSNIFVGLVISVNAGSHAVTIVPEAHANTSKYHGGMKIQAAVVSSALSAFLGFKESSLPQPGSRVLCLDDGTGAPPYIVGVIPQDTQTAEVNLPARGMLGGKNSLDNQAMRMGHVEHTPIIYDNRRPVDVVDGEHVISNEFGVLLGLYSQIANLKASELSQIQCHLLDDLVRVISHNFQHYTALGEYNIYHDGKRLMAEFGATHKPTEMYGRPAVNTDSGEPIFEKDGEHKTDDSKDFFTFKEDERIKAIERFKWFLGSVGDFLHVFLVRPDPDEIRKLDPESEPEKPDTGLWDLHVGTDGGFHIRSVKEVFIEKTNWIRVPLRKAAPDDPKGDDAAGSDADYDVKEKFEFQDKYTFKGNPFNYALQIRDYVAYVNEKTSYQNFKKHTKDFYVNDDISKETNLKDISRVDQETELNLQRYELRTAGIYLMPNGGITIRDAWNSAIVMEGGNVYLQPAKDLVAQPLRNNIVRAGGNINMTCRKHLDLSSSEEGLRLKSEKAQYLYSNKSGIVLESNGKVDSPGTPDPEKFAVEDVGGIVLKSNLGIYSYANKSIVNYAKQTIMLQSLNTLDIVSNNNLVIMSKMSAEILADTALVIHSGQLTELVSDSTIIVAGAGATVLGQKDQKIAVGYSKDTPFIDILEGIIDVPDLLKQLKLADIKKAKSDILGQTPFKNEEKFDKLKFKHLASNQYGSLNAEEDGIPATLAQQDDLLTKMYNLTTWKESAVNDSYPYPGKDLFENFYYSTEKPVNLEKNDMGKDYSNKADSSNRPGELSLKSLNEYKVYKT